MTVVREGGAHNAQLAAGLVTAIFAYKALVARLGPNEGAVHAEVFARERVLFVGDFEHMVKQFNDCVMLYEAFAVLGC